VSGDEAPLEDGIRVEGGGAVQVATAASGALAYVAGDAGGQSGQRTLVWLDREGRETPTGAPPRMYTDVRLSPMNDRAAVVIRQPTLDVWIYDFTRLTKLSDAGQSRDPVWSRDGQRVAYSAVGGAGRQVFWKRADGVGGAEALTDESRRWASPESFASDGSLVVRLAFPQQGDFALVRPGQSRVPAALLESPIDEATGRLSPDGQWLAYVTRQTGRVEAYVRPFPNLQAASWPISTDGGNHPMWNPAGGELLYLAPGQILTSVPVRSGPNFSVQPSRVVGKLDTDGIDVAKDGRRFLAIKRVDQTGPPPVREIVVVQNWVDELTRKLPEK